MTNDDDRIIGALIIAIFTIMVLLAFAKYLDREQGLYVDRNSISYVGLVNGR